MDSDNIDQDLEKELDRKVPVSLKSEQMLLGAILLNNKVIDEVESFLKSEHFYEPLHQKIYEKMQALRDREINYDLISVNESLKNNVLYDEAGSEKYLKSLTTIAMVTVDPVSYGKIIYDLALKRDFIQIGRKMISDAYESTLENPAMEQLESVESQLHQLAHDGVVGGSFTHINKIIQKSIGSVNRAMKNPGKITGITTGLTDLDNMLTGFQNSDLVIIAGRPAMGKTAFAMNFAYRAAEYFTQKADKEKTQPKSVGFFSLEMPDEQLSTRLLSMMTEINSKDLKIGNVPEEHYNNLLGSAKKLAEMPFFIDDTAALSIAAVRARARRLKRKHNLGIIFIDYLQLMRASSAKDNRVLEISEITQGLKALAKELDIPVIALAQLSRAVELRSEKKPILSDLRESGSIEQDADIVMFLYREEYYLNQQKPSESSGEDFNTWSAKSSKVHNVAEILVAKHRNGAVGTVKAHYRQEFSAVGNLMNLDNNNQ